jgi:hypothetical protein
MTTSPPMRRREEKQRQPWSPPVLKRLPAEPTGPGRPPAVDGEADAGS